MTARKPAKPKPRKRSTTRTLEQRIKALEKWASETVVEQGIAYCNIRDERDELSKRIEVLETRAQFRDASHDEPVSNAGEVIGQHFRIMDEKPVSRWRQFLTFMRTA